MLYIHYKFDREREMSRIIYRIGLILCLLIIIVFSHSSTGTGDAVLQSASLTNGQYYYPILMIFFKELNVLSLYNDGIIFY